MGANDCLYSKTTDIYVKVYVTVYYFETCQIFPQKLSDRKGTKALFAGRKKTVTRSGVYLLLSYV